MNSKQLGNQGEDRAASYLSSQGIKIIKRNFKRDCGEVDIIGEEYHCLIFVEVKCWNRYAFEELEYAVDNRKQQRIIQTALRFIQENPHYDDYRIRFDVIFLSGRTKELHYLPNAFEGDGAPL